MFCKIDMDDYEYYYYTINTVVVKIVVTKNILKLIVPSEPLTAISTMLRNTLSVDAALLPLTEYPTA